MFQTNGRLSALEFNPPVFGTQVISPKKARNCSFGNLGTGFVVQDLQILSVSGLQTADGLR